VGAQEHLNAARDRDAPLCAGQRHFARGTARSQSTPAPGIAAIDLFAVPSAFFKLLYGLVILGHERRRLINFGVTADPSAEWAGEVTDAFPWDEAPRYLIRARDRAFGPAYIRRFVRWESAPVRPRHGDRGKTVMPSAWWDQSAAIACIM
jgi:hypothetical protein